LITKRRKVCVWLPEDLYEALIAIAPLKAKKMRGSMQELLEGVLRDYIEGSRKAKEV